MNIGSTLFIPFLLGSIGFGYFIYGKKQQKMVPMAAGLALCIYPYFITNLYATVAIGILLMVVPWFIKL